MGACDDRSLSCSVAIRQRAARARAATSNRLPVKHSQTERIVRHWHEAVPNDRLAHLVKDASRAFVRALQSRLARHRVPFGQWTFLRILWESDGLTQRELSAEAGVMEPTTHVALNAMEQLGYIRRQRLAADRRNVYVHLTAKGRELKAKLVPLAEEVNEVGIDGIDVADVATTRRVLIAIIDNLAKSDVTAGTEAPRH
ncbi:MAG: winged helix-turn-helix transcriptional regulator [Betaproteobacteria bacterium]|nr:MAG: winged helix-turn-helix transcriptional regulator [Betaproteobacteria bacterium]